MAPADLSSNRSLAYQAREQHAQLLDHCGAARAAIDAEHAQAVLAAAAVYLPTIDPEAIARCAQLTAFRGFERRDPIAAREHERKVLQTAVRNAEDDPRYRDRERQVGERGELTLALVGANEALATAQVPCDRFESQEGFLELIAAHYDTPQFAVPWYRADYWKMWAAGDRICRELGLDDFGDDIRPAYERVAAPRDVFRTEVMRLVGNVAVIHEVVRAHDAAVDRLQHLDTIYIEQSQTYLAEHLAQADVGLLMEWTNRVPDGGAILVALKRVAGIRAKRAFVADIEQGVGVLDGQLATRISKYDRKIAKVQRGKWLSEAQLADDFDQRAPRLQTQASKTRERLDRLVAARDYDTFDPSWPYERWWWHLTGSPPTRLAGRTRGWYDAHPEITSTLPRDADDPGVAEAFVAGQDGEAAGGYLS